VSSDLDPGFTYARLLEAQPLGSTLWVRGVGRSMAPLLRSGDSLQVRRLHEAGLRRGDIAFFIDARGSLVAHLVTQTDPVRTASFLGVPDAPGATFLGRAEAVRRGDRQVGFGDRGRWALTAAHRVTRAAYGFGPARAAVRLARTLAGTRGTAALRRRWLEPITVRALDRTDLDAALIFLGDRLPHAVEPAQRNLGKRWGREGAAAGAFSRGRLVGFAFLDEYRQEGIDLEGLWVRNLLVAPHARGLGLARQLVEVLLEGARAQGRTEVLADVRSDNAPALALFDSLGFIEAPAVTETVRQRLRSSAPLVALSRRL
jgi:ribosomal protein S18 acetylase RimI-like enzyme